MGPQISEGLVMIKTILTREQLDQAQAQGLFEIELLGDIADKVKAAQQVARLGQAGASILGSVLGAAVVAGLQKPAESKVSKAVEKTGASMNSIVASVGLGVGLVMAIFSNYEEIEYQEGKLILRRRSA